jgi:hypothetical protein
MKPAIVLSKKLKLNRESLRVLNDLDLTLVAGGKPDVTHGPCGTSGRICA